MKKKSLLILVLLGVPLFSKSQTVVIAKKTKDAIYVGADTRITWEREDFETGKLHYDTSSICKIYQVGKFNIALIGYHYTYAIEYAKKTSKGKKTFPEYMNGYGKSFAKFLALSLDTIKRNNPKQFLSILKRIQPYYSQAIFFGIEADTLFMTTITFQLDTLKDGSVVIWDKAGEDKILAAGHVEEIIKVVKNKETWKDGEIKTINRLISEEKSYHPFEVNDQIDILKVTKKGSQWLQRSGLCN